MQSNEHEVAADLGNRDEHKEDGEGLTERACDDGEGIADKGNPAAEQGPSTVAAIPVFGALPVF
jgi:hypothetical protein